MLINLLPSCYFVGRGSELCTLFPKIISIKNEHSRVIELSAYGETGVVLEGGIENAAGIFDVFRIDCLNDEIRAGDALPNGTTGDELARILVDFVGFELGDAHGAENREALLTMRAELPKELIYLALVVGILDHQVKSFPQDELGFALLNLDHDLEIGFAVGTKGGDYVHIGERETHSLDGVLGV